MVSAILLLAGSSTRFEGDIKKQFIKVDDKELFIYPLETLYSVKEIDNIFLVCHKDDFDHITDVLSEYHLEEKEIYFVEGGETRQKSVLNALRFIKNNNIFTDKVLIHDAARFLVSKEIIEENLRYLDDYDGTTTYLPISDSLISINNNEEIENYLNREKIKKVQTPQAFKFDIIIAAHEKYEDYSVNDDASLLLMEEISVKLIKGSLFNFKVTTSDDLELLKLIIEGKNEL